MKHLFATIFLKYLCPITLKIGQMSVSYYSSKHCVFAKMKLCQKMFSSDLSASQADGGALGTVGRSFTLFGRLLTVSCGCGINHGDGVSTLENGLGYPWNILYKMTFSLCYIW